MKDLKPNKIKENLMPFFMFFKPFMVKKSSKFQPQESAKNTKEMLIYLVILGIL